VSLRIAARGPGRGSGWRRTPARVIQMRSRSGGYGRIRDRYSDEEQMQPVRVLMADGKWLVPPSERVPVGPPPIAYRLDRLAEPERANCVW
jgi:hypothetical protein